MHVRGDKYCDVPYIRCLFQIVTARGDSELAAVWHKEAGLSNLPGPKARTGLVMGLVRVSSDVTFRESSMRL